MRECQVLNLPSQITQLENQTKYMKQQFFRHWTTQDHDLSEKRSKCGQFCNCPRMLPEGYLQATMQGQGFQTAWWSWWVEKIETRVQKGQRLGFVWESTREKRVAQKEGESLKDLKRGSFEFRLSTDLHMHKIKLPEADEETTRK